ncbi:hypothetical protein F5887DRAFT_923076 [Amanita rubescens]|nr:hypothetical protein F5887DRAFT_923076 [Amanita rubescens]
MAIDQLKEHLKEVAESMNQLKSSVAGKITYSGAVDVKCVSGIEAGEVLAMIEEMVPVIEAALSLVGDKKKDFLSLPPGIWLDIVNPARILIKFQMGKLHKRALKLADSMIGLSPDPAVEKTAKGTRNQVDNKFQEVIKIYS